MSGIIFIGSNPSQASQSTCAFDLDTKSWATLCSWIDAASIYVASFDNVSNIKTPGNRPLNAREIHEGMRNLMKTLAYHKPQHIVAVGKTAHKALTKYEVPHLEIPHPSGLNRKLNDPKYVESQIDKLRSYYNGPGLWEVGVVIPW